MEDIALNSMPTSHQTRVNNATTPSVNDSDSSIDHYSEISQKSTAEDEQFGPYEFLDVAVRDAHTVRLPAVYDHLANSRTLADSSSPA